MSTVIVELFSEGRVASIRDLTRFKIPNKKSILQIFSAGRLDEFFRESSFFEHEFLFTPASHPAKCLENISKIKSQVGTKSYDLIFGADFLDNVPDDQLLLRQIWDILKPGGHFVFTVPFRWPVLEETGHRSMMSRKTVKNLQEQKFRRKSDFPLLIFREYGMDILAQAREIGFQTRMTRPSASSRPGYFDPVFVFTR